MQGASVRPADDSSPPPAPTWRAVGAGCRWPPGFTRSAEGVSRCRTAPGEADDLSLKAFGEDGQTGPLGARALRKARRGVRSCFLEEG